MDKTARRNRALDLMLEDLYTRHTSIRVKAKEYECEEDLDFLKEKLISYLNKLR
jgi:hypothetical protein